MFVVLEGPDCVGKTTLFGVLRRRLRAAFVPKLYLPRELWPVMPHVEKRCFELIVAMYDPGRVYVCDRCVFTSAPVYDSLEGRSMLVDPAPWWSELRVLYLDAPLDVLRSRMTRGDEHIAVAKLARIRELYEALVLPNVEHVRLDARKPVETLAQEAVGAVCTWCPEVVA